MAVLEEIAHRRIPGSSATRWNFKSRTVRAVFELKDSLIECCNKLESSNSAITGSAASGIKRMLLDSNFLFWLEFFYKVMPRVDILFAQLQSSSVDAVRAASHLTAFSGAIQQVRDNLSPASMYTETLKRRCDDGKIRDAKEVCDLIFVQCQERFRFTGHLEASKLLRFENASEYLQLFPSASLENCAEAYPMVNSSKLQNELCILYSRRDIYLDKSLLGLLVSLSCDEFMQEIFPEVVKLLKIVLTTPMTTAEPERCFSTLKRIKTFLRSTMSTDRLSALAMVSIESKLMSAIKDFNELVIDLFARSKIRRINLIYK